MRLLPVIDLKNRVVVQGVGGRREEYQPIRSVVAQDASPAAVAHAFRNLGFHDVYVADLDAIGGSPLNEDAYQQIADQGLDLWIDAGFCGIDDLKKFAHVANADWQSAIVLGSESVANTATLRAALEMFGTGGCVFSLDMRNGRPIVANSEWSEITALEIAREVVALGYQRMIVLDLVAVGVGVGPVTVESCKRIHANWPQLEIISGGGIRSEADVELLVAAGCQRVLVASALHSGALSAL